jgi:glycosyltransferase involved in cell wall biosynthesis
MPKLVYVGFKFLHMGAHAGYDLVKYHVGYDFFLDCQKDYERLQSFFKKKNLILRIYAKIFGQRLWWVELRCLLLAVIKRDLIFHFIYAENIYRYLGLFKWLGFKIVCTYHQPISFYNQYPQYLRGLKYVDKVIVLSKEARQIFVGKKMEKHIHFIPHGIDSEFFCPDLSIPQKREIIMVGNWLRNFNFAAKVFEKLLRDDPFVVIHVVTLRCNLKNFNFHPRMRFYHDISDEELLQLYRSTSFLFLALDSFVANNAVLEMASIGKPILIASDSQHYELLKDLIEITPLEVDVTVKKIIKMLDEPIKMRDSIRNCIINNYSWQAIGKITRKVLLN